MSESSEMEITKKPPRLQRQKTTDLNDGTVESEASKNLDNNPDSEEQKRLLIDGFKKGNGQIEIKKLKELARSRYGLVDDQLRQKFWPQLVGVKAKNLEKAPSLDDFEEHPQYHRVVADVNRALKYFPPCLAHNQRMMISDKLKVLILRVKQKHPNEHLFNGYYDVAAIFLHVLGEEAAYAVMEQLSMNHFSESMQEDLKYTERRLMYIPVLMKSENPKLYDFLQRSKVGISFALQPYLTWFGRNLSSYKEVVRLYDFFLASPMFSSIFFSAAILLYRADEILSKTCDRQTVYEALSKIPEDLPIENLLQTSSELYEKYSLKLIELELENIISQRTRLYDELESEEYGSIMESRQPSLLRQIYLGLKVIFFLLRSIIRQVMHPNHSGRDDLTEVLRKKGKLTAVEEVILQFLQIAVGEENYEMDEDEFSRTYNRLSLIVKICRFLFRFLVKELRQSVGMRLKSNFSFSDDDIPKLVKSQEGNEQEKEAKSEKIK